MNSSSLHELSQVCEYTYVWIEKIAITNETKQLLEIEEGEGLTNRLIALVIIVIIIIVMVIKRKIVFIKLSLTVNRLKFIEDYNQRTGMTTTRLVWHKVMEWLLYHLLSMKRKIHILYI